MTLGISPLVEGRQSLKDARHTFKLARSAARQGNQRLAVSRGITAAVQAAKASCLVRSQKALLEADNLIQDVRELVQGIIIKRAVRHLRRMA